ncbi:NosD domain-containing protein [Niabella ginsenosidivorans]|uniref:NosD domain-containing protein n=1 Tax=Niabella ginsenosidivorans TaxID=1176587 RepID=UPI001471B236|nr:alginate lyase family protein [Niabella ginsenosidivorans]
MKAQQMLHPGINQNAADLAEMKRRVRAGEEPWKSAFDRLKAIADTPFVARPFAHVLRGPYARPNIGGNELSASAEMAYNYALVWYITSDRKYARKAIAILNAWSPVLWDFDYNDAKLLAAWTGHVLCNAAELLKYTNAGWEQKDIDAFRNMLMTVYYPLLRYYFPEANGNWDGAIIHSIMAIAVFTDNRAMFDNAVDHFLHGPVNGSVFKYIYPNGQCQESPRDQGHVQLGLGEFAGAAQVAYTQGLDLFSIGNNRIGMGFEYTAGFLLGKEPHCYCTISERAKNAGGNYEYVYRHYKAIGVELPFVKKAADAVRPKAARNVLTSVRQFDKNAIEKSKPIRRYPLQSVVGAGAIPQNPDTAGAVLVLPGQSVQAAIDRAAGSGGRVLIKAGIHILPATLQLPSGVHIYGEGMASVLFLDPASGMRDAIVNKEEDMHNIALKNLVIEGSGNVDPGTDPNSNRAFKGRYNRGGIIFRSSKEGGMHNITLEHITVRNCTFNGVLISGADSIAVSGCDLSENGGNVIPGASLQHNLLLTHCQNITISNSRLVTSPYGSGAALEHCKQASLTRCEIARNGYYGVLISESEAILVRQNLIEGNDRSGVLVAFLYKGSNKVITEQNLIHYNGGYGLESYAARGSRYEKNIYEGNGTGPLQEKISEEKSILMY